MRMQHTFSSADISTRGHPQFAIIGDCYSRKVQLHGIVTYPTGGMMNGNRGEFSLEEVNAAFVREQAVDCIAESFGPCS